MGKIDLSINKVGLEHNIQKAKAYEAAALSEDAQAVNIRIKRLRKYYDAFSKKAGLPTQYERAAVTY